MDKDNSILNSYLYKIENGTEFFAVENLIKEIHSNLKDDRQTIQAFLAKALSDSTDLQDQIKTFNEINALPNVLIFQDIPNKYLDNLNNNASNLISLLNSIQKLQSNYISSKKTTTPKNAKSNSNLEDLMREFDQESDENNEPAELE